MTLCYYRPTTGRADIAFDANHLRTWPLRQCVDCGAPVVEKHRGRPAVWPSGTRSLGTGIAYDVSDTGTDFIVTNSRHDCAQSKRYKDSGE